MIPEENEETLNELAHELYSVLLLESGEIEVVKKYILIAYKAGYIDGRQH